MKKLLVLLFVISASAMADEAAMQKLMNAVTVCPNYSNPMTLLADVGANSFSNPQFIRGTDSVVVDAISNPQLNNPLIRAPIRVMGKIRVDMQYPAPGYGLVCSSRRMQDPHPPRRPVPGPRPRR